MALVAISVCALSSFVYAQRNDDVLRRAGTFVLETSNRLSGVIADESYQQKLYAPPFSSGTRRLIRQHGMRAEALFVGLPAAQEWMFVRNVVTVDRQAVSDSGDRLDRLSRTAAAIGPRTAASMHRCAFLRRTSSANAIDAGRISWSRWPREG